MARATSRNAPWTIRSTHTVSQLLTERGTMSVPTALYHAVRTSNAPTTAAAERPMSGTTTKSPGGQRFLRTYRATAPRSPPGRFRQAAARYWRLARPGGAAAATRPKAASDSAISRRIFGTNSRTSGAMPPSASTLLTTRTPPVATGSSTWSKTTLPSSIGHSLTQRRPGSTTVIVKGPPRLPRCLAHPDTPRSNGPSSRAISLLASHSGQRATSVHTAHTAAGPACSAASHSNKYMLPPRNSPGDQKLAGQGARMQPFARCGNPPATTPKNDGLPAQLRRTDGDTGWERAGGYGETQGRRARGKRTEDGTGCRAGGGRDRGGQAVHGEESDDGHRVGLLALGRHPRVVELAHPGRRGERANAAHQGRVADPSAGHEQPLHAVFAAGPRHQDGGELGQRGKQIIQRHIPLARYSPQIPGVEQFLPRRLRWEKTVVRLGEQDIEQVGVHHAPGGSHAAGVHALPPVGGIGHGAVHQRAGGANVVGNDLSRVRPDGDVGDAAEVERPCGAVVTQHEQGMQERRQRRALAAAGDIARTEPGYDGQPAGLGDPGRLTQLQSAERRAAVHPVIHGLAMARHQAGRAARECRIGVSGHRAEELPNCGVQAANL